MRRYSFIAMAMLSAFANAESSHRELILKAMKSPSGTASMEISGPMADMIRGQINRPEARIVADVSTVGPLPQEGCKRFLVRFTTPGTLLPTKDGQSRMLDVAMKLNMCENGMPPGVDDEKARPEKIGVAGQGEQTTRLAQKQANQ